MIWNPNNEYLRERYELAQDKLEEIRENLGNEKFVLFVMQVLAHTHGKGYMGDISPESVVRMCEKSPVMLVSYIKWYNERIKNG